MTTDWDESWRGMDKAALDAAYNNTKAVSHVAEYFADWEQRGAGIRSAHPRFVDLRYGPRERNRLDVFAAGEGAPAVVFIHGGYWQARAKEHFTFLADGLLPHGLSVAMIAYTLAPEITLDGILDEVRAGLDHLVATAPQTGIDATRLILTGWSAGGHLTAMTLDHPSVVAGVAISGLFDLEPIRHAYINDLLRLPDAVTAARLSPRHHLGACRKPLSLVVGGAELSELRRQTADYGRARAALALPGTVETIEGANHFTILEEMARPDGRIVRMIRDLLD